MHSTRKPRVQFDRSKLPMPKKVLTDHKVSYRLNGQWLLVQCPFHKNGQETNYSLSMHLTTGHFCCHACGKKGPDVIAFHRLMKGISYLEALASLGVYNA